MKNVAPILAFLALAASALAEEPRRVGARVELDPLEGKAPPPLQVEDWNGLQGDAPTWTSLRGKVVLVDFWGAWAEPCRQIAPKTRAMVTALRGQGLEVLGVHSTTGASRRPAFLQEFGWTHPTAIDKANLSAQAYKVRNYPTFFLIDRSGVLRYAGIHPEDVEKTVRALLAEPAP